jgi:Flp pilus assembly protein TadD
VVGCGFERADDRASALCDGGSQWTVEIAQKAGQRFIAVTTTNYPVDIGNQVRVGPDSSLALRHRDQSIYRFPEKSAFEVAEPQNASSTSPTVRLLSGALYFFHRGKPGVVDVLTRWASAAVRGTEFQLRVDEDGTTVVTVIDGVVDLGNEIDKVEVTSGKEGVAERGKAPFVRPAIDAINVIQWTLYYPGVLDVDEVPLSDAEHADLRASIEAYHSGDLLRALSEYPAERDPQSDAERIYRAALLLATGQVDDAEKLLARVTAGEGDVNGRLKAALRNVIAAVKLDPNDAKVAPESASEWLAESYSLQAQRKLKEALVAARSATQKSPRFGFAWARVADLEFSFGRIDAATQAVTKSLELAPRNAQALALNGFLFAARNKMDSAMLAFNEAIAIDGRLGNAWLGRGLVQISKGKQDAGREDMVTAAAMEPQRAFLRSYLGKAWSDAYQTKLAEHELELAQHLDEHDPTAWLYAALLKQQNNRINEAVADLEHAQDLGGNRGVYRSEGMLSGDRAVRSANLANIYRDAGMIDWSIYEAGRAVSADYANYSAHLFLANSYDQLRDPNRINLRYETPAESEYLIANLLAPVAAGTLSQSVSQGEYSRFFEGNRFGLASTTEYLSRGAWYENGAHFGIFGNSAYSIEGIYRTDPGQRVNNDFEERDVRVQVKQQLTYKDSVFFRVIDLASNGGDRVQYYDQGEANPFLRTRERQQPILVAGYHHEWSPSSHTLVVGSQINDTFWVQNPTQPLLMVIPEPQGLTYVEPIGANQNYRTTQEIYSGEIQQIWQAEDHLLTVGARVQAGEFETLSEQSKVFGKVPTIVDLFGRPPYNAEFETPFERVSAYIYDRWELAERFSVISGLSYDRVKYPENFRASPISDGTRSVDQISPKAGFEWKPFAKTLFRGAYTKSLSGASIDQNLVIEPTQVAGINQSFRSLIPESFGGSDAGAKFETFGLALQQRIGPATFIGVSGDILYSKNERILGTLAVVDLAGTAVPGSILEDLEYRERRISIGVDQLINANWAIGTRYRLGDSRLDDSYPEVAAGATTFEPFLQQRNLKSILHEFDAHVGFRNAIGFFGTAEVLVRAQTNSGYPTDLPVDTFCHVNFVAGYRFWQSRAEVAVGVLNLMDKDYRLSPLTPFLELPHDRTFYARFRISL